MANVASLLVNLIARTAAFDKKLKRSKGKVSTLGRTCRRVGKAMKKAFKIGALAATAMGTAVLFAARSAAAALDNLGKTSDKLGIMTENLIGLTRGAERAGISGEAFQKSLGKMVVRLSEANKGTGLIKESFDKMGVSFEDLNKMSPDQQLSAVADILAKVTNHADKVRMATELFGQSGIGMINMLSGGSAALTEMIAKSDELGLSFTRFEIGQVEAANDAFDDLGSQLQAVAGKIAVELAPLVLLLSEWLTETGVLGVGAIDKVGGAISKILPVFDFLFRAFNMLKMVWKAINSIIKVAIAGIMGYFVMVGKLISKLLGWVGINTDLVDGITAVGEEFAWAYFDSAKDDFASAGEAAGNTFGSSMALGMEKKLKANAAAINKAAKLKENKLLNKHLSVNTDGEGDDKSKDKAKAGRVARQAFAYNASLINVAALSIGATSETQDSKKNMTANEKTAKNTQDMLRVFDKVILG